jgi:hypothetical protein
MMRWISSIASYEGDVWWFDEWDGGVGNLNWLGTATGARTFTPTLPTSSPAIIVLQFQNGCAYLYPAGNNDSVSGLSAVTIPQAQLVNSSNVWHIHSNSYYSDPSINTGAQITAGLTINPRDCIFTSFGNL